MSDKPIKSWNIKTRFQSASKTVSTNLPPGFEKRNDSTSFVITGWNDVIAADAEKYKRPEIDWENKTATWYELSYSSGNPLNTLTVKTGTAYVPVDGDWEEPTPEGYGFFMNLVDTNNPEDYIKVHDPWVPATTDGKYMFQRCGWLDEWNFEMPELVDGTGMFSQTYMRRFRDPSQFGTSLRKLDKGQTMFTGCSLDKESIRIISSQIKDHTGAAAKPELTLGIDASLQNDPDVLQYLDVITRKNWKTTVSYTNYYIV